MISAGADRASIVSDLHQQTVIVQGSDVSGAAGDISLEVEYTSPGGDSCSETIQLTTIEVELSFRSAGEWEMSNGIAPQVVYGGRTLGSLSPGNPVGCTGFWKNVEIKGTVHPNDPALPCSFKFRQRRTGRAGLIIGSTFIPDTQQDCPDPLGCADDPDEVGQDTTLSPDGAVYTVDCPGMDMGPEGDVRCTTTNEINFTCMNFETWLEADGQPCTSKLLWFAITQIQCDGAAFVSVDPPDPLGVGSAHCSVPSQARRDPPVAKAIALLRSDSIGDRLQAHAAIGEIAADAGRASEHQEMLIRELTTLAETRGREQEMHSSQMLALNLLGVLAERETIDVLMRNLLIRFRRILVSQRDSPPSTVSARALARLGIDAVPAIVEKTEVATDDEWVVLQRVLRLIDDQDALRRAICAALDSGLGERAEQRLASVVP
jgi:hypothetical protein